MTINPSTNYKYSSNPIHHQHWYELWYWKLPKSSYHRLINVTMIHIWVGDHHTILNHSKPSYPINYHPSIIINGMLLWLSSHPGSVTIAYYNYSSDHPINYHQLSSIINSSTYYQSWLIASINHPSSIPPFFFAEVAMRFWSATKSLAPDFHTDQARPSGVGCRWSLAQAAARSLSRTLAMENHPTNGAKHGEMPWKCHENAMKKGMNRMMMDDGWWVFWWLMIWDELGGDSWGMFNATFPVVAKAPHSDPPPKCRCGSRGQCWCPLGDTWRDP